MMIGNYKDDVIRLKAENAKLIYQLKIEYQIEDEGLYDEFEKSKHYSRDNLIVFNRMLNQKVRLLKDEKERQKGKMIFDERSLDEIINGYKQENESVGVQNNGFIKTTGSLKDFKEMYSQYRRLKEKKVDYIDNTASVLEQLKKLRKNT